MIFYLLTSSILEWSRGSERLLIVLGAIASIYFGYRLFMAGIFEEQRAEIEAERVKIRLQSVGPGVFFSLFGSIILIFGVMNKLSPTPLILSDSKDQASCVDSAQLGYNYFDSGPDAISFAQNGILAINKIAEMLPSDRSDSFSAEEWFELRQPLRDLLALRDNYLVLQYVDLPTPEALEKLRERQQSAPDTLSDEDREKMAKLRILSEIEMN